MNSHRIDILDEADGDHISFLITYYFKLELFPAADTFFNKNLSNQRCLKTSCTDCL